MAEIENLKIGSGGTIHIVGNEDIVAEAWAAGQSYVKDKSYVINNHILYVCNTSHTSTSPFDPANWTQITVGESLTSLVDAINEVIATSKLNPVYGNTASGSIATFDTSLALPLQDCTIDINAVQESGTPTPSSPKLISGFTGANIKVQSRNWIPLTVSSVKSANRSFTWSDNVGTYRGLTVTLLTDDGITITGIKVNGTANAATNIMTPTYSVQGSYIFNGCVSGGTTDTYYMACKVNGNWLTTARDFGNGVTINGTITQSAITIANGAQINNLVFKPMLRVSTDTDSTYTPYTATTYAISWQDEAGTVYGGSLDVTSGKLTVTHKLLTMRSNTTSWYKSNNYDGGFYTANTYLPNAGYKQFTPFLCTHARNVSSLSDYVYGTCYCDKALSFFLMSAGSTLEQWKQYLEDEYTNGTPVQVVCELATPVTYQLTPTQISAIVGTNNVFTDTNGNSSVVYACSLKDYIDSQ